MGVSEFSDIIHIYLVHCVLSHTYMYAVHQSGLRFGGMANEAGRGPCLAPSELQSS